MGEARNAALGASQALDPRPSGSGPRRLLGSLASPSRSTQGGVKRSERLRVRSGPPIPPGTQLRRAELARVWQGTLPAIGRGSLGKSCTPPQVGTTSIRHLAREANSFA